MRSYGSLVLLVFLSCAGVASAASQQDREDCKQDKDHDRRIAGCTRVVQDQGESASDRAVALRNRGLAYDAQGAPDRAMTDFDAAIKLDPKFAPAYSSRGAMFRRKREFDRAMGEYNEAIKLDANLTVAYFGRGSTHLDKKDYDRAIADLNEAIRLDPTYANALGNRGIAYAEKGEHERASADYNAALRIRLHPIDFTNRGVSYFKNADYDRAIADFGQAIKIDPKSVLAFSNRGAAYNNKRDYDRAIADYDRALKLDPNFSDARTGRERAQQAKRAAAPPQKSNEPQHWLSNNTPVAFNVIYDGKTVCSLAPGKDCWWPAGSGQHVVELRRQDGKSMRKTLSISGFGGVLHQLICPLDVSRSKLPRDACP